MHPAQIPIESLLPSCDVRRQRRSGPGGQHRNKVETAVVIVHRDSQCVGEASERRSQEANRQQAIQRLRVELALQVRSPEPADAPSDRWRNRLRGGRMQVSPQHDDFPALLAEALDCLARRQWELGAAAEHLGCSNSQLVKFLKLDHRALAQLNAAREARGLGPLQ